MCKASKYVNNFIQILDGVTEEYDRLYKVVHDTDLETCDLLHKIELSNFNAAEGYYLSKQLQEVRQKRRDAKDELETLTLVNDYVKGKKTALANLKLQINNKLNTMEKRQYNPRTDMFKGTKVV
jgi:hypothetical protein